MQFPQYPSPLRLTRLSLPPSESVQKSPTLARVHRVTLKLEEPQLFTYVTDDDDDEPNRRASGGVAFEETSSVALLKGSLLTQVQGTFFRKWKERYFLLTRDFLSCFKLSRSGPSTMGAFIYKIRLAEVRKVEWSNSRSDALGTITIQLGPVLMSPVDDISPPIYQNSTSLNSSPQQRAPILLRAPLQVKEAVLYDWFESIEENAEASKLRRAARSASFGSRDGFKPTVSPLVKHNNSLP